jgi:hypothetical protein
MYEMDGRDTEKILGTSLRNLAMSLVLYVPALAIATLIIFSSGYMAFLHAYGQQFPSGVGSAPLLKGLSDLPNFTSQTGPNLSSLFKELNISNVNPSLSGASPAVPEVRGTYKNDIIGFQVDLPAGWSGKELKFIVNTVIASPKGNQSESDVLRPNTIMTISGIDAASLQRLANFTNNARQDLLGFSNGRIGCKVVSSVLSNINGIPAEEIVKDCNDKGIIAKGKAYVLGTQDDSIIVLGFTSRSSSSYDQYLPLFEDSVKTLKISKPGDISKSEAYNKFKEIQTSFS